jgi:protein-tyrosine phosphatase
MEKYNHKHHGTLPFNYDYIEDGIFIGSSQCCIAGLNEVLAKEGVSADISLEADNIDSPYGVDMYLWLPTKDLTPPSSDAFSLGITALAKLVDQRRKVYVHCRNGHGRAPTLVIAYFMVSRGLSADNAEALVHKKRHSIHLEENQKEALQKLEHKV